jgi:hypothetical protein
LKINALVAIFAYSQTLLKKSLLFISLTSFSNASMEDISYLLTGAGLTSLLVLTLLEIVLGIDNVIFISIISDKLPKKDQGKARNLGLAFWHYLAYRTYRAAF